MDKKIVELANVVSSDNTARCGWCLTSRCDQCLPSGDGWACSCEHSNIDEQRQRLRAKFLNGE